MRVHRLEIQGFGPFPRRVRLDVDRLGAQGLFLLHGPTGSGKTSLLDAVCFALYGSVPGERAKSERLTSDHVDAAAPQVVLEVSFGTRRFEVTRTPAWQRPKTRGTGTTPQPASVLVRELVEGEWVARTHRLDEAGMLLGDALGMTRDQFTQVMLLPQHGFADFLRAPADERTALLERLFGTRRFADVERWLSEQRTGLAREVERVEARRDRLLGEVEEATATLVAEPPTGLHDSDDPLALPADRADQAAAQRAQQLGRALDAAQRSLAQARHRTAEETDRARDQLEEAQQLARAGQDCLQAVTELAQAQEAAAQATQARERLNRGLRAEVLRPRLEAVELAQARHHEAERRHRDAHTRLQRLAPAAQQAPDAWSAVDEQELRELTEELAGSLPLEAEAVRAREAERRLGQALARAEQAAHAAQQELTGHRDALAELTAHRQSLPPADPDQAAADLDRARTVAVAAARVSGLTPRVRQAHEAVLQATETAQRLRHDHLSLLEIRLGQMAGHLARELVDGQPCPVCGSAEHPAPAPPGSDEITDAQVATAREAADRARTDVDEVTAAHTALATELAAATAAASGLDVTTAGELVRRREDELAGARSRAAQDAEIAGRLAELSAATPALEQAARERAEEAAATLARHSDHRDQAGDLAERLHLLRAGFPDVGERLTHHRRLLAALTALEQAAQQLTDAEQNLRQTLENTEDACRAAGFENSQDASAAVLEPEEQDRLQARVRAHDDTHAAATARVASLTDTLRLLLPSWSDPGPASARLPRLQEIVDDQAATLTACGARAEAAAQAHEAAIAAHARAQEVCRRSRQAVRELTELAATNAPLREELDRLTELAATAAGTGAANTLRIRLSAWVLGARLQQVVDAANERLTVMTDDRYRLLTSTERAKGARRAGLGLRVLDAWTSVERDTASLSGGETFLVSLSLALGLADVVQAEAGGISIETLFIDEGFGSLDEQTLELVMTCLDRLREGGRTVGVVSHVSELRARIPHQVQVIKGTDGSTLTQLTARAG